MTHNRSSVLASASATSKHQRPPVDPPQRLRKNITDAAAARATEQRLTSWASLFSKTSSSSYCQKEKNIREYNISVQHIRCWSGTNPRTRHVKIGVETFVQTCSLSLSLSLSLTHTQNTNIQHAPAISSTEK
jgi:hypothetical protein